MPQDFIAEQASWLDGIFTHAQNQELFDTGDPSVIQKELANRWVQENRLELLNELADRFGETQVFAVIDKIIAVNCGRDWAQVGKEGDNALQRFIKLLWEPLQTSGFVYSLKKEGNKTKFQVTQCPLYNFAREVGAEKWFYHLFCLTDKPAAEGFNSRVKFSRTRTLMEGFAECDHCYTELDAG